MAHWTIFSKEHYNHTYHLTALNRAYLDSYISAVSGHDLETIRKYSRELERDENLRRILTERSMASPERHNCDLEPRYGRRIGWYALIRATRPRVVVETGVDRGLGTVVIASALLRNQQEGFPGTLYATDIVPNCGHLLAEPYKGRCVILIGDSVQSIKNLNVTVDVFLHDSDHRPEYEWAEYLAVEQRLSFESIVLSDNSIHTPKLLEFAERTGRDFLFFQDQPLAHWWPGEGIGAAFRHGVKTTFSKESR